MNPARGTKDTGIKQPCPDLPMPHPAHTASRYGAGLLTGLLTGQGHVPLAFGAFPTHSQPATLDS
jgi:hypothetical protein